MAPFHCTFQHPSSITRRYSIPPDMTEAEVGAFELEKVMELREQLEPIFQAEFDERIAQAEWTR